MLAAERQHAILERLRLDGKVVASAVVAELGVSDDTVRRDLRELTARGLLRRVHGGALPPLTHATFAERLEVDPETKAALARATVPLLDGAGVVVLGGGTTTLAIARLLPESWNGTILTNSLPVATALALHPAARVVVLGGDLRKEEQLTVGHGVIDALAGVRADVCVVGVCSLDLEAGLTGTDRDESAVEQAMVAGSALVVAPATAEKVGATNPWPVAPLRALTHLVTDADPARTAAYATAGITIVPA